VAAAEFGEDADLLLQFPEHDDGGDGGGHEAARHDDDHGDKEALVHAEVVVLVSRWNKMADYSSRCDVLCVLCLFRSL